MSSFVDRLKHGFCNLTIFRGRDTRGQFLPFLCVVLAGVLVVSLVLGAALTSPSESGPSDPQSSESTRQLINTAIVAIVGLSVFLGASVSRRLRDTGRNAAWSVLPLPFMVLSVVGFADGASQFVDQEGPGIDFFLPTLGMVVMSAFALCVVGWFTTRPTA